MTKADGNRVSMLIQLDDRPGALEGALAVFRRHGVNLTHIESRPARGDSFDFYVDCEGDPHDAPVAAVVSELGKSSVVFVLGEREVPWFPRHVSELDRIARDTVDAGDGLEADHPGFNDDEYRSRRDHIDALAQEYRFGDEIPVIDYTPEEHATWAEVYRKLTPLHQRYACPQYLRAFAAMERECGFSADEIPQGRAVDRFLAERTGFRLWPVAGLLSPRHFLNGLAFRRFFSTQYIRHHSRPLYTPEPDVCHELIGHAPMFADAAFADLSQEIGLASLGASDSEIEHLARCYWFSVEFGLQGEPGDLRAYGAGLLSSFGELEYACASSQDDKPEYRVWAPAEAAKTTYPITEYQPIYFVAATLQEARARMRQYCRDLPRPFHARYNAASERIWVDRAVHRASRDD